MINDARGAGRNPALHDVAPFLPKFCPAASEEFRFLFRHRLGGWRAANILRILERAEAEARAMGMGSELSVHPRLASAVIESGSWIEAPDIQNMWSGLLVSSCSPAQPDENNLLFIQLLGLLATSQARVFNHACVRAEKFVSHQGFVLSRPLRATQAEIQTLAALADGHLLGHLLERMRTLGLITGRLDIHAGEPSPVITPTPLAFHMYVRCQGSRESPVEFFGLQGRNPAGRKL